MPGVHEGTSASKPSLIVVRIAGAWKVCMAVEVAS